MCAGHGNLEDCRKNGKFERVRQNCFGFVDRERCRIRTFPDENSRLRFTHVSTVPLGSSFRTSHSFETLSRSAKDLINYKRSDLNFTRTTLHVDPSRVYTAKTPFACCRVVYYKNNVFFLLERFKRPDETRNIYYERSRIGVRARRWLRSGGIIS